MAGVEVVISGPDVAAHGDVEMLREALLNLLMNAGQAIDGRGVIRVAIEGGAEAVVRVSDQGPGIPPDLHDKIFEPFFTTKRAGTGLGLSIVRRLVELQYGSVSIESRPGEGTTVLVKLPIESSQTRRVSAPVSPDRTSRSGSESDRG
jgi:signal transduction histidine kinase